MNEEFVQFPTSNDEGKKPDDDFEQFLSGLSDDDKSLDFPSIMDKASLENEPMPEDQPSADSQSMPEGQSAPEDQPVEAELPAAGVFDVSGESEPSPVSSEWSLPDEQPSEPAEAEDTLAESIGAESSAAESTAADPTVNLQAEPAAAPEPFQADAWLAEQKQNENYHSLLILKGSKTWKYTGDLSLSDIHEVERIIAESRNTRAIDMARYARLGESQHKYLLYTTSISGSLILCSVNYAFRQLSEIRSQTRASASQLSLTDDEVVIPDVIETKKVVEPEQAHKPVKLETGEAAQVMLDDLLRSPAQQADKDETFKESDGWVLENSDAPSGAVSSVPDDEAEILPGPETLNGDSQPEPTESVIIPKGGYGRVKNGKPMFGKLFHLTEDQIAGKTGLNILKPGFKGISKVDSGLAAPQIADWIKEKFADWSPVYTDLLANRTRLKNRKPPQQLKHWRPAPPVQPNAAGEPFDKDVAAAGYVPVITEAVSELPDAEAWPAFEAEEVEPVLSTETPPAAERIEIAPAEEENVEIPPQIAEPVDLTPPETLEGIDLSAGLAALDDMEVADDAEAAAEPSAEIADELLAELEPAESLDTTEAILAEEPTDLQTGDVEEDQVFVDESSDFLKELSNGGTLDSLDQDQDATAFFEEYFNRSGELIETEEPDQTGQTGPVIEEFIPMEEVTPTLIDAAIDEEGELTAPEDHAPAADEEPLPDFTFNLEDRLHLNSAPETGDLEMKALSDAAEEIFTRSPDADETALPEAQVETPAEETPAGTLADFDFEVEDLEEKAAAPELEIASDTVAEEASPDLPVSEITQAAGEMENSSVNPEQTEAPLDFFTSESDEPALSQTSLEEENLLGDLNLDAEDDVEIEPQSFQTTPPAPETIKTFDIDQDYNQMIIAMQQRMSAFDRAVQFREEEEGEKASPNEAEKGEPASDDFAAFAKSAAEPEADNLFDTAIPDDQSNLDIQAVISSALSEPGQETPAPEQTPAADTLAEPDKETLDLGSLFNDDVFPWEVEGDAKDMLEATPTPQALAAGQAGEGLVDLLSDTNLDPVHLGFDQPMYTCILVPELSEYSLTNEISAKIREWLPRLSRVFGWQFENIFIQPAYLQWTVRVPTGTSQGSIVRKVRQQTSLRIFETYPELKRFSPDGNFWAKGYLVVAGSNPPPAEFLEDFIQKNRKPADFSG